MKLDLAKLEQFEREASAAPWSRANNGTGAIYIHAETIGVEKVFGREQMATKKRQIGKLYDGFEGALPHRPENGKANAEFIVQMRNAAKDLFAEVKRARNLIEAATHYFEVNDDGHECGEGRSECIPCCLKDALKEMGVKLR